MIKNVGRSHRRAQKERWKALQEMSPEEPIALGEALPTSEVMTLARSIYRRRPKCLAVALGITSKFQPPSGRFSSAASEFDASCQIAFRLLEEAQVRHLLIGAWR